MQKLEMLIKTVDAHYDSLHQVQCVYLSCSLLNIARGTCNLMITNEKSNYYLKNGKYIFDYFENKKNGEKKQKKNREVWAPRRRRRVE